MKYSLKQLSELLAAELVGDGAITISSIAPLATSTAGQASFIVSPKFRAALKLCQASVVLLKTSDLEFCATNALVVKDPYVAYAKLAQLLDTTPEVASNIASSAVIADTAAVAESAAIGANAVIAAGVELAANVQIGAGVVIAEGVTIGANTKIMPNVTIYHGVQIGSDCVVHSNTVIGSDGFGYANDAGSWVKIPQVGTVIIGDRVEIGASSTIDRGALDNTILGDGVIIDNQCQIAHNVEIGDNTAFAGFASVAGSTKIGRNCFIGGAAAINGHITICDQVQVTGMSMVAKSIKTPGVYSSGIPAQPNREWRKMVTRTMKIDDMYRRLQQLEQQLESDK